MSVLWTEGCRRSLSNSDKSSWRVKAGLGQVAKSSSGASKMSKTEGSSIESEDRVEMMWSLVDLRSVDAN